MWNIFKDILLIVNNKNLIISISGGFVASLLIYRIFFIEKKKFIIINPNKKNEEFRQYHDKSNSRQKGVEKFYKDQHKNQNYEFVTKKRIQHLKFDKCVKTVWKMAAYLDTVSDESDPDTDLSQLQHAIQTAEACRKAFPGNEFDWFHVTCFIHDLGKILLVNDSKLGLKSDPQWAVVGDNFPVGCQFSNSNIFPQYFKLNKDYNNPKYNTKYGIYEPHCGLNKVTMCWGHDEYIYQIAKNQSILPDKSLYMLRYHSFYPWHNKGGYMHLCNDKDLEMIKWVQCFNQFDLYSKNKECSAIHEVSSYYKEKIKKYFPKPVHW